jgi:hypothetical protein
MRSIETTGNRARRPDRPVESRCGAIRVVSGSYANWITHPNNPSHV